MSHYKSILVGLDLADESDRVIEKALSLRKTYEAKIHLVHVLEPLTFAYGGDIPMDLTTVQNQLVNRATEQLKMICGREGLTDDDYTVLIGQPASELHNLAEDKGCDLIIVGSHGRHGLSLLLGSTANAVLHGANCDILAVRV